jgi:CheY-like chemotaxis protein
MHIPEMEGAALAGGTRLIRLDGAGPSGGGAGDLTDPSRQAELRAAIANALERPAADGIGGPAAGGEPPSKSAVARRVRVLLAEDNAVNQLVVRRTIERAGHEVAIVNNGREALETLARRSFDLVLMDVQMPEMDGFEATAEIRRGEQGSGRHQFIVAMTAHAIKGDRERCLNAGMDDYLSKPIKIADLASLIEGISDPAAEPQTPAGRTPTATGP